ncbi:MAG: tyrosine-type recombinase/integrase [Proteobacteria bacterium]|nr:tyrosine-type recombinase/integrase [Pseudomonadota bacterium]
MGSIYLRGETLWIKYYRLGKPYRESANTKKETEAKRLLKLREGQVEEGKFPGLQVNRTRFNDLKDGFLLDYKINNKKSLDRAELSFKHLETFFGNCKATDITTNRIKEYITKKQDEGMANGSINRTLAALKRSFSLALRQTPPIVASMPYIPMLKENNVRTGFYSYEEYVSILDKLPDYMKGVFKMGYFTGMRKEEILSLQWSQVNLFDRTINLEAGTTKNDEARILYLAGELHETILEQQKNKNGAHVFHRKGERIKDFRFVWEKALRACGYKPTFKCKECNTVFEADEKERQKVICPKCESKKVWKHDKLLHDLRRSAVRNMIRAGIPEKVAMKISGHKTRSVFDRYNIVNEEDLKVAALKVSDLHKEHEKLVENIEAGTVLGTIAISSYRKVG